MITYDPFWTKLKAKKITTYALIKKYKISGNTLNRLKHNKPIDTTTIDRLCEILDCNANHILKYVKYEQTATTVQGVDNTDNQLNDNAVYQQVEHIENDNAHLIETANVQHDDNADNVKEYQQTDITETTI